VRPEAAGPIGDTRRMSTTATRRDQLGDFLRRRRESLTPEQAGLPTAGRRRTPGLRRDEVATRAAISTVYYERLEQGRGAQPSAGVLTAIAGALRLDAGERDHLYRLGGHVAPASHPEPPASRPECPEPQPAPGPEPAVDPGLLYVLQAVAADTPGFISDDLGTVVAQNELNVALFGRFAGAPGREANLIWRWFTSPAWRFKLEPADQHEQTGQAYVADLRAITGQRDYDPEAGELVAALRAVSADFARMWDEHRVAVLHCATKQVDDDRVGRLKLDCEILLSPLSRQRMLLLRPAPGTGTERRLAELRSMLD
jgi:transcriptional regulator with XRE-family HTH domain